MKSRIAALTMALVMLLCMMPAAMNAETLSFSSRDRDVTLIQSTKNFYYRPDGSSYYRLITSDGVELVSTSAHYTSMYSTSSYSFLKVEAPSEDGVHDEGLLDPMGRVLVPAKYARVEIISDRWQAGIHLTPSSADDKDYTFTFSNNEKKFYRIDAVDFYFDGQMVGTLSRSDYAGDYTSAYGAYIMVTNTAKEKIFYNSKMEKSPRVPQYSGEFETESRSNGTVYYHVGSGQQVFVESCTLNPADLVDPYLYDHGIMYDIRGRMLYKTEQYYDSVYKFYEGYARVRMNRLYGLMDEQGREVIPPLYEDLTYSAEHPFMFGYTMAEKDGKFGFLDMQGNVTCPFTYNYDLVKRRGTFGVVQDLTGTYIVLSAAVGELPEHYAEVSFPTYNGCLAFVATNANKEMSIVDIYGNTLLPYTNLYRSITLSNDGSLALLYSSNTGYTVMRFQVEAAQKAPEVPAPAVTETPAAKDDGSWTCVNGHSGNTGNFCGECGSPRPVEEKLTNCPNCQYKFGDQVPNFCPNCGQSLKK